MRDNIETSEIFFKHGERGNTIKAAGPLSITDKIRDWSIDRNLHEANPIKQSLKLGEETGELFEGLAKGDEALIKDAIGDIYVVLTIMSQQLGFTVEDCIELAYGEIKDRRGKLVDGIFVKEEDFLEKEKEVDGNLYEEVDE